MTRYLIRARDAAQFQKAKALLEGHVSLLLVSDRRLFLAAGDVPEELQDTLRSNGLRVSIETPAFTVG